MSSAERSPSLTRTKRAGQPAHARMLDDVRRGLSQAQKELPPTYFYDAYGSQLFDRITTLPEYYLTRAEREILQARAEWIAEQVPAGTLAELGAGSASKTAVLLSALRRAGAGVLYVPIDVAPETLEQAAQRLRAEFRGLHVRPLVADMRATVRLPRDLPPPVLYAFLGSTIGNFEADEAVKLLAGMRATLTPGDAVLLGTDLVKEPAVLHAAYDDAQGVTAEFNLNVLRVLNRELGANFVLHEFAHEARWNPTSRRIEMHLVAQRPAMVQVPGAGRFPFREGESIRTEVSCKYDRASVEEMLGEAGLLFSAWMTDAQQRFALTLARVP